jgi:RNA polymerase sigma factor (TIGR02999 family)
MPPGSTLLAMKDLTLILRASGNFQNSQEVLVLVYEELRRLAAARMARESAGQTLQATALVHEAWLQLVGEGDRSWENRAHFFGAASNAMRRILVDAARRKSRQKRGAGQERVDIAAVEIAEAAPDEEVLLINEALEKLEREDPEQAQIVVMKFFGGLTNEEVAASLGIGERTVYRQWVCAKARLFRWVRQQE